MEVFQNAIFSGIYIKKSVYKNIYMHVNRALFTNDGLVSKSDDNRMFCFSE